MGRPIDRLQVCVIEYDVRAFASKFMRNGLQVALRCSLHDLATDKGTAGERDLVDVHVLAAGLTDCASVAFDNDYDARREACFVDQGSHSDGA